MRSGITGPIVFTAEHVMPRFAPQTALVSSLLLALLCGCPAPEHPPGEAPPGERCTPDLAFCDGNAAKLCGPDGRVLSQVTCAETEVCVEGVCEGNLVCQPNERICVRNVLNVCNERGTGFASEEECGDLFCADGACTDPGTATCPAGVSYCVENTAYQCNADGTGLVADPEPCGERLCVNGACLELVCAPGTADCDGETAHTCNALGTGYSDVEECLPPEHCVLGRCQEVVCVPGRSCEGNVLVTCNDQGTQVVNERDCAPAICREGACVLPDAGLGDATTDAAGRDTGGPDTVQADVAGRDAAAPDGATPDAALPDAVRPDVDPGPCDDGDGDGYGRGGSCLGRDCDDDRGDVYAGAEEFCDGRDNDCDGSVDEECACSPSAEPVACPTAGLCAPNAGHDQVCSAGQWTVCPVAAQEEACDGEDNDCNGLVDDLLEAGDPCTVGVGVCERVGVLSCDPNQRVLFCDSGVAGPVGVEACGNSADDDCDGRTDEADCCPLRTAVDPATQLCRRDARGELCQSCVDGRDCGGNADHCVIMDSGSGATCDSQNDCPSADEACLFEACYYDEDCPGGGTCESSWPGLLEGSCSVGRCENRVCGLDCREGRPCPAGFSCFGIYLVAFECEDGSCPDNDCYNSSTNDSPSYTCRLTGEPCGDDDPCVPLTCVEGHCQIGRNCLPSAWERCAAIPESPPCGTAGCGEGATCVDSSCRANTQCSEQERCPLGEKCVGGDCVAAERCLDNGGCDTPSFFCNAGFCDNAEPCASNNDCPDGTYCELDSSPAICRPGCRHASPSGCDTEHHCDADHRCMLNEIVPGGRCSPCSDDNPCGDTNLFCNPFTNECNYMCLGDSAICQLAVVPESECLYLGCTNPDCP